MITGTSKYVHGGDSSAPVEAVWVPDWEPNIDYFEGDVVWDAIAKAAFRVPTGGNSPGSTTAPSTDPTHWEPVALIPPSLQFRHKPGDLFGIEFSEDGGTTWIDAFEIPQAVGTVLASASQPTATDSTSDTTSWEAVVGAQAEYNEESGIEYEAVVTGVIQWTHDNNSTIAVRVLNGPQGPLNPGNILATRRFPTNQNPGGPLGFWKLFSFTVTWKGAGNESKKIGVEWGQDKVGTVPMRIYRINISVREITR